jgi:hypothetical protein
MDEARPAPPSRVTRAQWGVVILILAVTAASIAYRLLVIGRLEQTSLLFIGIPGLLAIVLATTPKAKTAKGAILRGTTLALLLSGPVLGEGFICIMMAAPLFLLIALVVGLLADRRDSRKPTTLFCLAVVLVPMSIEGTSGRLSFDRSETVRVSRVVRGAPSQVAEALAQVLRTDAPLPAYLRAGFPRPTAAAGSGLAIGAGRSIHFAGGEGHPGDLTLRVEESRDGHVRFTVVSDTSKIAHWLEWKSSDVDWSAVDADHTRVTWTIRFDRRLDPAWYFRPWERYAVHLAADYLIQANATPAASRVR